MNQHDPEPVVLPLLVKRDVALVHVRASAAQRHLCAASLEMVLFLVICRKPRSGVLLSMIDIVRADVNDSEFADFVAAHLRDIAPTAPDESQHALDLDGLRGLGDRIWVARSAGKVVGTAALASLDETREELKSMRTHPEHRGLGIASQLLSATLHDASSRGIVSILLETGSMDFFAAARSLYVKFGFQHCGPFGSYGEDPNSVFMHMRLADRPLPVSPD